MTMNKIRPIKWFGDAIGVAARYMTPVVANVLASMDTDAPPSILRHFNGIMNWCDRRFLAQAVEQNSWEPFIQYTTEILAGDIAADQELLDGMLRKGYEWVPPEEFELICDPNRDAEMPPLGQLAYRNSGVSFYYYAVLAKRCPGVWHFPRAFILRSCEVVYAARRDRVEISDSHVVAAVPRLAGHYEVDPGHLIAWRDDVSLLKIKNGTTYTRPGVFTGCD